MSMKRSRRVSHSAKGSQAEGPFAFSQPPPAVTWNAAVEGKSDDAFKPYAVTSAYKRDDLIAHPKFGKGVVTMVEGTRVEILFEEGAKKLGHAG
jgi:hypothetical protein